MLLLKLFNDTNKNKHDAELDFGIQYSILPYICIYIQYVYICRHLYDYKTVTTVIIWPKFLLLVCKLI